MMETNDLGECSDEIEVFLRNTDRLPEDEFKTDEAAQACSWTEQDIKDGRIEIFEEEVEEVEEGVRVQEGTKEAIEVDEAQWGNLLGNARSFSSVPIDSASEDWWSEEEEEDYFRFRRPSERDYIGVEYFGDKRYGKYVGREFWAIRERRFRLTDIEGEVFKTQIMPRFTIATFRTMLVSNFGYERRRGFHAFGAEEVRHHDHIINGFLDVVKETRVLGINTEGHMYLHPSRKEQSGEPSPLVMLALANLSGTVLFFQDAFNCPPAVKVLLEDIAIVKIGSGLNRECEELERIGIKLQGWAASGAIYRAFLRNEARTGLKAQADFLDSHVTTRGRFPYKKYIWTWATRLKMAQPKLIPEASIPHIQMNVRLPLAIACAAVLEFAEARNLDEDSQGYPILWEALDLVRGKVAEDLEVSSTPIENWVAGETVAEHQKHRKLNDARELTFLRQAQADFVEEFYDVKEKIGEVFSMYVKSDRRVFRLPPKEVARRNQVRAYLAKACAGCGSDLHPVRRCPKVGKEGLYCPYPHDGQDQFEAHTLRTCPALHSFCGICYIRGHHRSVHKEKIFTQRELRHRFHTFQAAGLLTSIPLLAADNLGRVLMNGQHFRFGLTSLPFRRDSIERHMLCIPPGTQLGRDEERAEEEGRSRSRHLAKKIGALRENAQLSNPLLAPPIRRRLVDEEMLLEQRTRKSVFDRLGWQPDDARQSSRAGKRVYDGDSERSGQEVKRMIRTRIQYP